MSAVEGTSAVIIMGRCAQHRTCPQGSSVGRPQRPESRNSAHDANDVVDDARSRHHPAMGCHRV